MIQVLQCRVTLRAKTSLRDRMVRVALDLDCPPLPGAYPHPALGGAAVANRRVPSGDSGCDIIRSYDVWKKALYLFGRATRERCAST